MTLQDTITTYRNEMISIGCKPHFFARYGMELSKTNLPSIDEVKREIHGKILNTYRDNCHADPHDEANWEQYFELKRWLHDEASDFDLPTFLDAIIETWELEPKYTQSIVFNHIIKYIKLIKLNLFTYHQIIALLYLAWEYLFNVTPDVFMDIIIEDDDERVIKNCYTDELIQVIDE